MSHSILVSKNTRQYKKIICWCELTFTCSWCSLRETLVPVNCNWFIYLFTAQETNGPHIHLKLESRKCLSVLEVIPLGCGEMPGFWYPNYTHQIQMHSKNVTLLLMRSEKKRHLLNSPDFNSCILNICLWWYVQMIFVRICILLELRMDSMTSFDLDLLHRFLTYYLVRINYHRWRAI